MRLSDREERCLRAWQDVATDYCLNFRGVQERSDIEPHNIRRVVRALARKGLLYFQRGLCDDSDGSFAGAGYGLTREGKAVLGSLAERAGS